MRGREYVSPEMRCVPADTVAWITTQRSAQKKTARKLFSLRAVSVDCLGLTEVVTLVAPRAFRCRAQHVPGGSDFINQSILTDCLREMFPIPPTKGSSRTPLRATALRLSHLTWSGIDTSTM